MRLPVFKYYFMAKKEAESIPNVRPHAETVLLFLNVIHSIFIATDVLSFFEFVKRHSPQS